ETAFRYVSDMPTSTGPVTVHCTLQWHVDSAGRLISDQPDWVPTSSDDWSADRELARVQTRPRVRALIQRKPGAQTAVTRPTLPPPPPPPVAPPPAGGYNPWGPVPGHPGYAYSDFAGDPYGSYFGVCTWYAWDRRQSEPLMKLGNAAAWAW